MVAAASCVRAVGDRDHRGVVGFEYLAQQSATHEAGVGRGIELHQRAVLDGVVDSPLDVPVDGVPIRNRQTFRPGGSRVGAARR